MRKKIAIGIGFFIVGIICTCFWGYEYFSEYGILNTYNLASYANNMPEIPALFSNILWERIKIFFVIWIISITRLRKLELPVLRGVVCFAVGVFITACIGNLGAGGILFFIASFLPHGLVYLAALILIFSIDYGSFISGNKRRWKRITLCLGIILLILLGCLLEAAVGSRVLARVISLVI
jgi:uncharacterized membrane protein SpoIIM required for sporulation